MTVGGVWTKVAGDLVVFFMTDEDKRIDEGAWHG